MLFSEKLKLFRNSINLTQEELAEKLNVSRQAITKWESGDGIPDIENLKQLSILFNVTIDELIKEDKPINIKGKYYYKEEIEIDHTKHFDIKISKSFEVNIKPNNEEKVKVEVYSDEENKLSELYKIKFDNIFDRLDINIKGKSEYQDIVINIYIPEKYIDEIELNTRTKTLNIFNLDLNKLEYDGELKYINVNDSKGKIVLNVTKCDIEAKYNKLNGILEVNTINSTARVELPKDSKYKTILKGIKNRFIDANNTDDSTNIIELNGANSKLIIIEK
ncbi:MAG: helix-turn-helix domain-containing protein [Bacilli bacterium]|nr:helix-turn-helix domain-containing protein [Bacilli bacterium]